MAHGASKMKPVLNKTKTVCPLCESRFNKITLEKNDVLVVELDVKSYKSMNIITKQLGRFAEALGKPILVSQPGLDMRAISIDELIVMKKELESK